MAVTYRTLAIAKVAFLTAPQPATAARYLTALREAKELDMIDVDDFHDGLILIEGYLRRGGSVVSDAAARTLRNL